MKIIRFILPAMFLFCGTSAAFAAAPGAAIPGLVVNMVTLNPSLPTGTYLISYSGVPSSLISVAGNSFTPNYICIESVIRDSSGTVVGITGSTYINATQQVAGMNNHAVVCQPLTSGMSGTIGYQITGLPLGTITSSVRAYIVNSYGTSVIGGTSFLMYSLYNFVWQDFAQVSTTVVSTLPSYTIPAISTAGGTISPASRVVSSGSTTSFTISSVNWPTFSGCGGLKMGKTYYTWPITGPCIVNVTYLVGVSTSAGAGGTISPVNSNVNYDSTTNFTIAPSAGYTTASVTGCGGSLSGNTYTTGAITAACTVSATYSGNSCTLPWGGTITSGTSVTTYQASSVVSPATCTSQVRTCTNGTLSGTYTNQSCTVTAALAVPTVTTPTVTSITTTGATLGANVTSLGNPATITARGTCWGTTASPITNCVAEGGTTTGIFTHARTGLTASTLYYYRGYADNSTGRGYSADSTFTTSIGTPTTPTISGPTTLTTGYSGTYSFVSTDPQGDQVRYGIDWNMDGTADNWLPAFPNYEPSGTSLSMSYTWSTTGSKQFQALSQDYPGNNSAWTTYTITVSDPQPCTAGVVDSSGSWAPTCSTSATCLTPPSPAQLTNQPGIQIGLCPTPEYTGNAYRSCSTATIICTLSTFCGDSTCNGSETLLTCPADCKARYQQF